MQDVQKEPSAYQFTSLDKLMLKNGELPSDAEQLERLLVNEGFDVTSPAFQKQVETRNRQIDENSRNNKLRQRPESYIKLRNSVLSVKDYSSFVFNFIFVVVGTVLGILLLFVSEVVSVKLGIDTFFGQEPIITSLLSVTLIVLYFAIEWQLASLLHKFGRPKRYKMTVGMIAKELKYFFNINAALVEKDNNHDIISINRTRFVLVILIVVLGILGRLDTSISQLSGAWYDSLVNIFVQSTLKQFLEYIGGGVVSIALLSATHFIVQYIYSVYVAAVGSDNVDFFEESSVIAEKQEALIKLLRFKLNQIWQEKEEKVRTNYREYTHYQRQLRAKLNQPEPSKQLEQRNGLREEVEISNIPTSTAPRAAKNILPIGVGALSETAETISNSEENRTDWENLEQTQAQTEQKPPTLIVIPPSQTKN